MGIAKVEATTFPAASQLGPLHLASMAGHAELSSLLLSWGSEVRRSAGDGGLLPPGAEVLLGLGAASDLLGQGLRESVFSFFWFHVGQ